jgi:hypothetical protein
MNTVSTSNGEHEDALESTEDAIDVHRVAGPLADRRKIQESPPADNQVTQGHGSVYLGSLRCGAGVSGATGRTRRVKMSL